MLATGAIRIVSLGMKKRTFIKISAALSAGAVLQPVPWSRLSWGAGGGSTARHGSGQENGSMATLIAGLQMVTAAGDVVEFSRKKDAEGFNGVAVGLGALGVITKITLRIQPTFTMRQYVYENMPL